jgi:L-2-hydroxyglutarate oxidase LhgO
MSRVDVAVIGAGIVGVATARHLSKEGYDVHLIEKNSRIGLGNTSRGSDIVHSGIYYRPDSLKSELCRRGRGLLQDYCVSRNIPYRQTAKLFLAGTDADLEEFENVKRLAEQNGVDELRDVSILELRNLVPNLKGVGALLSKSSAVVDSGKLIESLFKEAREHGVKFSAGIEITKGERIANADVVINSAGLGATDLSRSVFPDRIVPRMYPTKGSYLRYSKPTGLKHIVYPGFTPGKIEEFIVATPLHNGDVRFGPSMEPVGNIDDFSVPENLVDRFAPAIEKYFGPLDRTQLKLEKSGIRPRIYGPGEEPADFKFEWAGDSSWLDLWGIESPGLTASLAIAERVSQLLSDRLR